ncbi:GvpL/GvpF family gas vesicle protein [Streptomyces sp. 71268]|uniref:GvpL/GvpF family gas vesicle protein n=1 Tax=Streptomyces sp. 71268 TaxID=3002640 RepID=UPI0023F746BE|nr:GvpL/GvpF family gas vesicle protein [Streptomyces sp. 71268]WEV23944.1 GvpL/GvpF family gas vesicle protein [Streptomyces sp. 71268]
MSDQATPQAPAPPSPLPAADGAGVGPETGPCYAFAIGRHTPELAAAAAGVSGLDGADVRAVWADGLGALVCAVAPDAFSEAGLRAQLEDLERLTVIARSHHEVVAAASAVTTVLPLRLGTVYQDASRVAQMLREHGTALRESLDRLTGHAEWGVKVYAEPDAGPSPPPAADGSADTPGRAYLQRRRAAREARRAADRTAREVVARVRATAAEWAVDRVAHRPQQGELATSRGENLVNDAYLVAAEHVDAFQDAVRHAAAGAAGVRVELTGPWAPYSFATPPGAEPGGEGLGHES